MRLFTNMTQADGSTYVMEKSAFSVRCKLSLSCQIFNALESQQMSEHKKTSDILPSADKSS